MLLILAVICVPLPQAVAVGGIHRAQGIQRSPAYKVALGTQTIWGSGLYYHQEMLDWASKAGFDAIFYADDYNFLTNEGILNPGFENYTSSGTLTNWVNGTRGRENETLGLTSVNRTLSHTGSASLQLILESTGKHWADRYIRSGFPKSNSTRRHLFGNETFTANYYVANLMANGLPLNGTTIPSSRIKFPYSSEAWVYFEITLISTPSTLSPHSVPLRIFLVYDYKYPINRWSPREQNTTSTYYLYLSQPNSMGWTNLSVDLTKLARTLWNQTIVDYWYVETVEIGVRSITGAYVNVLFDDVSVTTPSFPYMMHYLRNQLIPNISRGKVTAYIGYRYERYNFPFALSVLGGNALAPLPDYNLTSSSDWVNLWHDVGSEGSLLVIDSPIQFGMYDRMRSRRGMGLPVADLSGPSQLQLWDWILSRGGLVMIAASNKTAAESDFDNPNLWTNRVWAQNNTESSLLEAIYLGRNYLARNSFNGEFQFDSYGFETGRPTIYIPEEGNSTVHVKVTNLPGGTVRFIANGIEIAHRQLPQTGQLDATFTFDMPKEMSYVRVEVTDDTGSTAIISNPIFFAKKPMPPNSYVYIEDPAVHLQSWSWVNYLQHKELSLDLTQVAQEFPISHYPLYINLGNGGYQIALSNSSMVGTDFYSGSLDAYVLPSQLFPGRVQLTFNPPISKVLVQVVFDLAPLYAVVLLPFAFASAYHFTLDWARRMRKRTQ